MLKPKELTDAILKAFYKVYNTLGARLPEKVHENALAIELRKQGFKDEQQAPTKVYYEGQVVGEHFSDTLVDDKVTLQIKRIVG